MQEKIGIWTHKSYLYLVQLILGFTIISTLISCGANGTSPSNSTPYNGPVSLGTLANGSSFIASSGNFPIAANSQTVTGTLALGGGTPGYTGTVTTSTSNSSGLSVKAVQNSPQVSLSPSPCVLVAGSTDQSSCQIQITIASTVPNGRLCPVFGRGYQGLPLPRYRSVFCTIAIPVYARFGIPRRVSWCGVDCVRQ